MGLGRNTHAICAVAVRVNCAVPDSEAARRLPPGAPVVSSSAYEAFPVCTKGVLEGEGVREDESVLLGVTEGVLVGLGDLVRVPLRVPLGLGVTVPEGVAVDDFVADREGVAPGEREGVGEGENSSTPCTYRGAAYMVPEFTMAFQTDVLKLGPVNTSVSARRP